MVRILAKRCRYAAEAYAPLLGKRTHRLASTARELQDVLGELNDVVVAERWLLDWAQPHSLQPGGVRRRRASGTRTRSSTASPLAMAESVEARKSRRTEPRRSCRLTSRASLHREVFGWRLRNATGRSSIPAIA
jgi:CHAD domain-containing protein